MVYSLDSSLKMREPGCDDGPVLPASSPDWFSPEPWEKLKKPYLEQIDWTGGPPEMDIGYGPISDAMGRPEEPEPVFDDLPEVEQRRIVDDEFHKKDTCGKTAMMMIGETSKSAYYKQIHCFRAWCPECGGKDGRIAKKRSQAVRDRINLENYGIRQLVLTVPEDQRERYKTVEGLRNLFRMGQQVGAKHFGEPEKTVRRKNGKVKEYRFGNVLAVGYLHLFGDNDGVFHPHINIHIFDDKKDLHISREKIEEIRKSWRNALKSSGCRGLDKVNVYYSYVKKGSPLRMKNHRIKYMGRPTGGQYIENIEDFELKKLVVVQMKGFLYIRFWGGMANCKKEYREMEGISREDIEEMESVVGEKLTLVGVMLFDSESWRNSGKVEEIAPGLFRQIMSWQRGGINERTKCKVAA